MQNYLQMPPYFCFPTANSNPLLPGQEETVLPEENRNHHSLSLSQFRVRHYVDWFNRDCICLLKMKLCCSYRNLLASICLCWILQAPSPLSQDQVLSASLSLSGRSCAAAWMPPRQEAMTGGCWPINSTWTGECQGFWTCCFYLTKVSSTENR